MPEIGGSMILNLCPIFFPGCPVSIDDARGHRRRWKRVQCLVPFKTMVESALSAIFDRDFAVEGEATIGPRPIEFVAEQRGHGGLVFRILQPGESPNFILLTSPS